MPEKKKVCQVIADIMLDEQEGKDNYEKLKKRIFDEYSGVPIGAENLELISKTLDSMGKVEESHAKLLTAIYKVLKCPV